MKKLKKITAVILSMLLIISMDIVSLTVSAEGLGTEENPYKISTAEELQNVNNDVTAHYILTADIDLQEVDFTPIGNADSGAFSGSFDGNGYTISNLNIFSGKYAGLFGCNEGIIQNVILSDIFVYGTRYVGGVVGQNTAMGTVVDCTVLSGAVESDGGINAVNVGGICGINEGVFEGCFSNGADVTAVNEDETAYSGGIIGFSNIEVSFTAENSGDVFGTNYAGGLIGYANKSVVISESTSSGDISTNDYAGGFVGYIESGSISMIDSANIGVVIGLDFAGGLIGRAQESIVTIMDCYNTGDISSDTYNGYSGGLIGTIDDSNGLSIMQSYNAGKIFSQGAGSSYSGSGTSHSGGLVGYSNSRSATIQNCYNSGMIISSSGCSYAGGLVGGNSYDITISNCYNIGNVTTLQGHRVSCASGLIEDGSGTIIKSYNSGGLVAEGDRRNTSGLGAIANNSYTNKDSCRSEISNDSLNCLLTSSQMTEKDNYIEWDFTDTWSMGGNINSGFPVLQNVASPLQLNIANENLIVGDTLQLYAYKDGAVTNDVSWLVTYGSATVNNSGKVTATGTGPATITAVDSDGNKANCNIYVMTPNTSASLENFSVNKGGTSSKSISLGVSGSGDFLTDVTSSDSSILKITNYGGTSIEASALSPGVATITFKTVQGFTGTCTATVTNHATSITINDGSSYVSIDRGEKKQITLSTSPEGNSSTVTWTSLNPEIATVDQNGNVTGIAPGSTTITATTDNGYSDTCSVYVYVPAESISFTETAITLEVGEIYQSEMILDPLDTTDSIYYDSSSTSIASVDYWTGLITAESAGKTTITATASSGVKVYIEVTVIDTIVEAEEITLSDTNKSMLLGDTYQLFAEVLPSDTTDKTVTYSSDDETVATIGSNGNITAVGEGTTLIRATTSNGISTTCMLTVRGFSEENGINYFDIYTPQDLTLFAEYVNTKDGYNSLNARLRRDIDMSTECSEETSSFTPIGNSTTQYNGIFNGGEYTISNLYISAADYTGLFGYLGADAKVYDVILENVQISGENYVGGIAGKSEGTIQRASVSGNINGTMYVGGVSGYNAGGTINGCANTASLSSTYIVGGIAGYSRSADATGEIKNSYSATTIDTTDYRVGGICGVNDDAITNCYYDSTLYEGVAIGYGSNTELSGSAKSTDAFVSGEVTHILNSNAGEILFYQTLEEDLLPVIDSTHETVYYAYETCAFVERAYVNIIPYHDYDENGVCTICGSEKSIVINEQERYAEGFDIDGNSVVEIIAELETTDTYIEIHDINGFKLQDDDLVGTGTVITVYNRKTGALLKMYTVVIYGDVNGDGLIDDIDKSIVSNVAICGSTIKNKWLMMAADTNRDGAIDAFDALEIDLQKESMHTIAQK